MKTTYLCNCYNIFLVFSLGINFAALSRTSMRRINKNKSKSSVLINNKKSQLSNQTGKIKKTKKKRKFHIVRVLLQSWPLKKREFVKISSNSGFWLASVSKKNNLSIDQEKIIISNDQNNILINGKKVRPDSFYIIPKKGTVELNGNKYKGILNVVRIAGKLFIVNCLDLESYICSVLGTESWPGWPLEVNKVFAIVSRSYVMAMIEQRGKKSNIYHVCDTNVHQTYAGEHASDVIRDAVEQTKGVFLGYNNKPILAMFDSCCGGVIPARIDDFDFSKAPYLARHYACNHCKRCKIFKWQAVYSCFELKKLLKSVSPKISKLQNVRIKKKDKAGIVQEVIINPGGHAITGKRLYSLLRPLKSFCFSIKRKKNMYYFDGRGFGHHIGLCQWGAREMVRDGWNYKRILYFYYPGTKLAYIK